MAMQTILPSRGQATEAEQGGLKTMLTGGGILVASADIPQVAAYLAVPCIVLN